MVLVEIKTNFSKEFLVLLVGFVFLHVPDILELLKVLEFQLSNPSLKVFHTLLLAVKVFVDFALSVNIVQDKSTLCISVVSKQIFSIFFNFLHDLVSSGSSDSLLYEMLPISIRQCSICVVLNNIIWVIIIGFTSATAGISTAISVFIVVFTNNWQISVIQHVKVIRVSVKGGIYGPDNCWIRIVACKETLQISQISILITLYDISLHKFTIQLVNFSHQELLIMQCIPNRRFSAQL